MELPPVVKGPLTTTHLVRWAAANGNYARIHWDLPFAQLRQGLANVVINGSLKNQYLGQLAVNFAGDGGWFRRFYVEHRGMDYPGDVITARGTVTKLQDIDGFGHVECRVGLSNNRNEETASGAGCGRAAQARPDPSPGLGAANLTPPNLLAGLLVWNPCPGPGQSHFRALLRQAFGRLWR